MKPPGRPNPNELFGKVFSSVELLGQLGRGTFSTVYEGICHVSRKPRAVKVADCSGNDLRRFEAEYRILAHCDSRHVVRVHTYGTKPRPHIVMDFVEGETLRDYTYRLRGVPVVELVTIGIQICRGLESLHSIGVIHRDLNLANIIRGKDGQITICDLGIAKRLPGFRGVVGSLTHPDLRVVTSAGQCGTPGFIAPEVGAQVTEQVDVFGLGAVLYALYTGREYDGEYDSLASSLLIGFAACSKDSESTAILLELLGELLVADPHCRSTLEDATIHLESIRECLAGDLTEKKLEARAKKFNVFIDEQKDPENWMRWVDLTVLVVIGICFGVALFDLGAETESAATRVVVVGPAALPESTLPPEQTAAVPEQTTAVPEQTAAVPEQTAAVPEQTAAVSERTLPEQAATLPTAPSLTEQAPTATPRPKRSRKKNAAQRRRFEAVLQRVLRLCAVTSETIRYTVGGGRVRLSFASPVDSRIEACVEDALPSVGRFRGVLFRGGRQ